MSRLLLSEGPDLDRIRVQWEMEDKLGSENDPDKPPKNAPKDWWIRVGQLVGAIAGAVAGGIVGARFANKSFGSTFVVGPIIGAAAGLIAGTIVGVAGSYLHSAIVRKRPSQ